MLKLQKVRQFFFCSKRSNLLSILQKELCFESQSLLSDPSIQVILLHIRRATWSNTTTRFPATATACCCAADCTNKTCSSSSSSSRKTNSRTPTRSRRSNTLKAVRRVIPKMRRKKKVYAYEFRIEGQ